MSLSQIGRASLFLSALISFGGAWLSWPESGVLGGVSRFLVGLGGALLVAWFVWKVATDDLPTIAQSGPVQRALADYDLRHRRVLTARCALCGDDYQVAELDDAGLCVHCRPKVLTFPRGAA